MVSGGGLPTVIHINFEITPWSDASRPSREELALEGKTSVTLYMAEMLLTRGSSQMWMTVGRPPSLTITIEFMSENLIIFYGSLPRQQLK